MNLTSQQKDLLYAIVDAHRSRDGAPFFFVQSYRDSTLDYPRGPSIPVSADEVDFHQLAQERLITFVRVAGPALRGKPTQLGIDTVASLRGETAPSGDPPRLAAIPTPGIAEGAMVNPFRQGAATHPGLLAHWDSRQELWTFRERALDEHGKTVPGLNPVPADPKTEDLFNEAVKAAFGLLRNSRDPNIRALTRTLREPCQVWLDLMRNEKRGFERIVQLRSSHWSSYARASEAGVALPQSATRLLDDGDIRGIIAQSATFWDDIAARGFELEAQHLTPDATAGMGRPEEAQFANAMAAKQSRASTVAKLINELNTLKPQMFEDEQEYKDLQARYPTFLTFRIAATRPDLKLKVLSIRSSPRHIRLAQELAAAHHGREISTIQDDWKDHKPAEFKRRK